MTSTLRPTRDTAPVRVRLVLRLVPAFLALAAALPAGAQEPGGDAGLSLDSLLAVPVHAAAGYAQAMGDAPAAVTVVTADEIAAHGYRTLADLLSGEAGFYTTYDRNYTYVGVRGFSRPGDYNNRLLVMIDGRPVNESVYGSALVGTEFGLDLGAVDRVEIVRGPVSALYGTSAMLAAVNLVTRGGAAEPAARVETGSGGRVEGAAHGGVRLGRDASAFVSAYAGRTDGGDVAYPEFVGAAGGGVARGLDWDRYAGGYASVEASGLRLRARVATRTKGVPTGAWGTTFGDGRFETTDQWLTLSAEYARAVRPTLEVTAGAGLDHYRYQGTYPGPDGVFDDANDGRRLTAEARLRWDPSPALRVTGGASVARHARVDYRTWLDGEATSTVARPFRTASVYVQNELQVAPWLSLTAGVRADDESFTPAHLTPRLAAVVRAPTGTVFKALYGKAFRSPVMYEVMAGGGSVKGNPALREEDIRAVELVAVQRLGSASIRLSVFDDRFTGLIDPVLDPADSLFFYANHGTAHTRGAEAELTAARGGWLLRMSATAGTGHDDDGGAPLTNSPARTGRLALSGPLGHGLSLGMRLRAESGRRTLAGGETAPSAVADVDLGARVGRRLRATLQVRNALDAAYAQPGGIEHLQDAIAQDGRSLGLRVEYAW